MIPFRQALAKRPIVFDGATGTQLYERGIFLNHCFDELCIKRPEIVEQVHRAYVDAGADVIQTNSYGANAISLARHGLADKAEEICQASVTIARRAAGDSVYIAGSIGPTGLLPKDLIQSRSRHLVHDAFRRQIVALTGVDLLIFETFSYLGELEIAIEAAYDTSIPICAFATFDDSGHTKDGAAPKEVAERLFALGVDVAGANCVLGPERTFAVMMDFGQPPKGHYLAMQPNAGYPRTVDGRAIYQASPETFGVVARRAFKSGISIVGGCCGTGPDHIRRVVASARMLGGGRTNIQKTKVRGIDPLPLEKRSQLGEKLAKKNFVVSVEVLPPVGLDAQKTIDRVKRLHDAGVDVVNIPDGPRATVRMSNIALARLILEQTEIEPLVHFCARDRNLLGLQSDLLGAHALGIHNLVVVTGDPPKVGDYPDATAVFDIDSIGMLRMAEGLNRGLDPAQKRIAGQTSFVLATGAEPAALDFEREISRLREKIEAGANFIMTQPVFAGDILDRFLVAIEDFRVPVLVGILPFASSKNAEFLHNNVPGMRVPADIRKRLQDAKDPALEGIAIAAEALTQVKDRVQGVYMMPPFGRVEAAITVLKRAKIR